MQRRACSDSEVSTVSSVSGASGAAVARAAMRVRRRMSSGSCGSAVSMESGESATSSSGAAIILFAMMTMLMSQGVLVEISQVKSQVKSGQVKRGRGGWGTGLG